MQRSKMRKAIAALPKGMPEKGFKTGTGRQIPGLTDAMKLVTNDKTRQRLTARYQRRERAG